MTLRDLARPLLVLLLLAAIGAGLLRVVEIRTDMADFLPPARTTEAAFLLSELREGAASTLLLAGMEGAPEEDLARLSRAVGEALRASGRFAFVGNGAESLSEEEQAFLFRYRYLLSPAVAPGLFETPALRAKLEALLDGLRSAASPVLARLGFADPVGAFISLLQGWLGSSRVELRSGAWFAGGEGPPRALLIARSRAAATDVEAQRVAAETLRDAFAAANPGPARLLLSGPGVFAAEAAASVRADVERVSILSGVLLIGFLLWRYRSPAMLLLAAVPLLAATLAGAVAVWLAFGRVQGAALGFGATMLGVVVDYPILLLTARRPDETPGEAARRIWPTLRLAAGAAALGLTAMVASGFPGLAQLGLFGAAGLLVGGAVTRWVLPSLVPRAAAPARRLPHGLSAALAWIAGRRLAAGLIVAAAAGWLAFAGPPAWEDDVARLSPVPEAPRRLDAELRAQLGAPDTRHLIALRGATEDEVLRAAERVAGSLGPLLSDGRLTGLDLPSRYLPSAATQAARAAALPPADTLRARLSEAAAGLPFRPTAFDPFLTAVEESRTLPPLTAAGLGEAPLLAARLSPLLSRRGEAWSGLGVLSGVGDLQAVRDAVAGLRDPGILFVDVKGETEGMIAATTRGALLWCGVGALGVVVLLTLGLGRGGLGAGLWAIAPIAGAVLVTLAALSALGERLTPFHLAALLLMAGVGMDYALFLGRPEQGEEADRTRAAVLTCAVATLLTFGLLALCETPVLRGIGLTVSLGVAAAFGLALALSSRSRAT
ncbi:MMPL family transporter [Muricoccus radiodurans]|uniref:MMPL family transporter n=1 Tax=Muricoccus radiodurans TaxID=2231721 RepID=UPI003CF68899